MPQPMLIGWAVPGGSGRGGCFDLEATLIPKLSDTQSILLASAAQRASGSLLPLPASIKAPVGPLARSLAALVKQGYAEEREVTEAAPAHRSEGDARFGLFITAAGKQVIGVEEAPSPASESAGAVTSNAEPTPRPTKSALVLALLQRDGGATLAELVAATGWLPYTTRAALTGLRKKGHALVRGKRDGATCYTVAA